MPLTRKIGGSLEENGDNIDVYSNNIIEQAKKYKNILIDFQNAHFIGLPLHGTGFFQW